MELILDAPPDDTGGWAHDVLDGPRVATIRSLIERRLAAIRAGDVDGVDATYAAWRRDHVRQARNASAPRDDYRPRHYVESIERPARAPIAQLRLSYAGEGQVLPHPGVSTSPGAPPYVATLTTDGGEQILWAVLYRPGEGGGSAFIEVPVFSADPIGFVAPVDPRPPSQVFEDELRGALWLALHHYVGRLSCDSLRAVAVECVPRSARVDLYVLTDREIFDEETEGRWALESWRCGSLTETPWGTWRGFEALGRTAHMMYSDAEEPHVAVEELCSRCASALNSDSIRSLLAGSFRLAEDFELGVFDPDDPDRRNHCA